MAALSRLPGLQVAVDIRTTKAVDGLLGVADQQQCAVRAVVCRAVDLVEQPVLQRRGVLELVNQRHRVLGQDAGLQRGAVVASQSRIQALQHIGKTESAGLALEPQQALLHVDCRMQAQRHFDGRQLGQRFQQLLQLGKFSGQQQVHGRALEGLCHPLGAEALASGVAELQRLVQRVLRPNGQRRKPACVVASLQLSLVPQRGAAV